MNANLRDRFYPHELNKEDKEKIEKIRDLFFELAEFIDLEVPVSREKSLSLTNLEESSFYAIAAISRY